MTIYQFLAADEMEQIEAFWSGNYVGERIDDQGHKIVCHQVDDFYVEYKTHKEVDHFIDVRAFRNPDLLTPYFDKMGTIDINPGNYQKENEVN